MSIKKIPMKRLKVAQIDRNDIPTKVWAWCRDSSEPMPGSDGTEIICHADVLKDLLDKEERKNTIHLTYENDLYIKALGELVKQFISYDYLIII